MTFNARLTNDGKIALHLTIARSGYRVYVGCVGLKFYKTTDKGLNS